MNPETNLKEIFDEFSLNLGFHFSDVFDEPLAKPYWIFVSVSHNCNFNCQMCGVKKILRGQETSLSILQSVFGEIAGWQTPHVITLTGGEPFLRQDIFEIISSAVKLGLNIEVVTNGSQINNPSIADRIMRSKLSNIAISLDGARAQTHDSIRQTPGAFQGALAALEYLSKAKKAAGSGPQISSWTTIMKPNVGELLDMIPIAKGLGVECMVYHPVIVVQEDMQNTMAGGELWLQKDDIELLRKQIDALQAYRAANGLVASLHDPYLWLKYFDRTLTKKDWKCNPFVFVDIGPDGFVRSCGPAFGNVNEISLTQCLSTPEARHARETMRRCPKACLQTCWARPEADSLKDIVHNFVASVTAAEADASAKKATLESGFALLNEYETVMLQHSDHGPKA